MKAPVDRLMAARRAWPPYRTRDRADDDEQRRRRQAEKRQEEADAGQPDAE